MRTFLPRVSPARDRSVRSSIGMTACAIHRARATPLLPPLGQLAGRAQLGELAGVQVPAVERAARLALGVVGDDLAVAVGAEVVGVDDRGVVGPGRARVVDRLVADPEHLPVGGAGVVEQDHRRGEVLLVLAQGTYSVDRVEGLVVGQREGLAAYGLFWPEGVQL